jgi:hypothetical protein
MGLAHLARRASGPSLRPARIDGSVPHEAAAAGRRGRAPRRRPWLLRCGRPLARPGNDRRRRAAALAARPQPGARLLRSTRRRAVAPERGNGVRRLDRAARRAQRSLLLRLRRPSLSPGLAKLRRRRRRHDRGRARLSGPRRNGGGPAPYHAGCRLRASSRRLDLWRTSSFRAGHAILGFLPVLLPAERRQVEEVVRAADRLGASSVGGVGMEDVVALA